MPKVSLDRTFAPIPECVRGKRFVLKSDPKGEKLIYCVASSVIIRDINDPSKCEEITLHAKKATVAAMSPSGCYICSGDITGTVKIWAYDNEEHMIKKEVGIVNGPIEDICWSSDSKKIVVVGSGKEKHGSVINWDSGSSVGHIINHSKTVLTCDMRQQRPMTVLTGGEDSNVIQFSGPPYQKSNSFKDHASFVNCIKYSPDGSRIASCGQNGSVIITDTTKMEERFQLCEEGSQKAHSKAAYSVSWSPDGKYLLSASGDNTCKVWNVDEKKCETVFNLGTTLSDNQMGCLWVKDNLISVSLSGKINFLNRSDPSTILRYYWGNNKSVVSMIANKDLNYIFTSSCEGHINRFNVATGDCEKFEGAGFTTQVTDIDSFEDKLVGCGLDDKVRFASIKDMKFLDIPAISLATQPQRVVMIEENMCAVGCLSDITLICNNAIASTVATNYPVKGLAIRKGSKHTIAAGGENKHVMFYKIENNKISLDESKKQISIGHDICYIRYSDDGKFLAVCTTNKTLMVYDADSLEMIQQWTGHSNRVSCAAWKPQDYYLASCGVDGNVNVWSKDERFFRIECRNAHKSYSIPSIVWLKDNIIATVAQQGFSIKLWKVEL